MPHRDPHDREGRVHLFLYRGFKSKDLGLLESDKNGAFVILCADQFNSEAINSEGKNFPKNKASTSASSRERVCKILKTESLFPLAVEFSKRPQVHLDISFGLGNTQG